MTLKKAAGGGAAGSVNVSFANTGRASHTLTIYSDEGFTAKVPGGDTAVTPGGGSASFVFVAPATATSYHYRCEIHTSMQGMIEFR
ncbi:MAG: hypothetical protein IT301_11055 [Dehalococcoidia bacterium]|nr:hypothetical protein [Dehalococcoidia bacterium]